MLKYYDLIIPVFSNALSALKGVLQKGEAFAKAHKVSDEIMLGLRLAPDMFPLVKQVQVASDNAKGAAARLSGKEAPKMEDNEKTFAELYARIDKTIAFLHTCKPGDFTDAKERKIKLAYFPPNMHFIGHEYLRFYAIPNFFFHMTTAYDILRTNGVPVGKADYTGNVPLHKD